MLALALREQGELGKALRHAEASVHLARTLEVAVLTVLALRRLAILQLDGYDLTGAEETLAQAEALNESLARRPRRGEIAALRCRHAWLASQEDAARTQARLALDSRDFREAEAWVERWPLVLALQGAGDAEALSQARDLCRALLDKSPRHRLEGLRGLALGEPACQPEGLTEALDLAERLELPQERLRNHLLLAALFKGNRDEEAAFHCVKARQLQETIAATLPAGARRQTYLRGAARELG